MCTPRETQSSVQEESCMAPESGVSWFVCVCDGSRGMVEDAMKPVQVKQRK